MLTILYIRLCSKLVKDGGRGRGSKILKTLLRLVASAYSPTIVELIVELIGELFIGELLNYNFSGFQKA